MEIEERYDENEEEERTVYTGTVEEVGCRDEEDKVDRRGIGT
jgi:hypothetical protein